MKIKTSWDFSQWYTGDNDPAIQSDMRDLVQKAIEFASKWEPRTDWLENPTSAKEALDEYEQYNNMYGSFGKVGAYIHLRTSLDSIDTNLKALDNKMTETSQKCDNLLQFFTLRLSKIPTETQKIFLNAPELQIYTHFLQKLFATAQYTLSEPEEKILTLKSGPSHYNWVRMTSSFLSREVAEVLDENEKPVNKTFEEILALASFAQKKTVRDTATRAFNSIIEKYIDVAVEEINSILQNKKINDEIRNAKRPDTMRIVSEDIDAEVIDTLLATVSENNTTAHEYYKRKAKIMGVEKLQYNERNIPLQQLEKQYSFEESVNLVHEVLTNLDQEFAEIFTRLLENGQVDVYPEKGKRGGAFCAYYSPTLPTFVFLNHTEKLNDVLTLAHEFGHAINGELMKQKENSLNYGTPMGTAEVASTFMEDFVLEELMKTATPEERKALIMAKLNDDISSIFRQVACYRFEQELHEQFREKGYLSKEAIGEIFQKHMSAYMGPAVDQPDWSQNWWVYWSHIRSFFYVYSYASGLLISKSLQAQARNDHSFIAKVKEFLKTGSSESPKEIFNRLGINITQKTFWQQGLDEVNQLLKIASIE